MNIINTIEAQEYLAKNTNPNEEKVISHGSLRLTEHQKLTGDLLIQDYPNLEEIDLPNHELTSLIIINCPNLKEINVRHNNLTKLELDAPELTELIAGQNELSSLDLTPCQKVKKLLVPDNSGLTEIKGLNLAVINNINIANTLVSLATDLEKLKQQNKELCEIVKKTDDVLYQKELVLVEPIETLKQADEALQRQLIKTETEWKEYFLGDETKKKENALLHLAFQDPELKRKGQEILIEVIKARVTHTYDELIKKWKGGDKYDPTYDFDGSLDKLIGYFEKYQSLLNKPSTPEL